LVIIYTISQNSSADKLNPDELPLIGCLVLKKEWWVGQTFYI